MKSTPSTSFADMKLSPAVQKSLQTMLFKDPTPIQAQAIPVALMGKDILGCAQTGTGKTGAFGIPLVESLIADPTSMALVLAPTRELALQIIEVLRKLSANVAHTQSVLLIGGASMRDQFRQLHRKPRIVVATPGRLMDHLRRKSISLGKVKTLVLDEADRMLDMGFAPQLEEILEHLPTERQTFLFSATLPGNIKALAKKYLVEPEHITIGSISKPVENIKHEVVQTTVKEKNNLLLDQLNARQGSVLIFVKTKQKADQIADYLQDYGFSAGRIHGDRSQAQRLASIKAFRDEKFRILVATDIAARGLDVPHIQHVINFDLPQVPEDYIHRIGRTARAGATGEAIAFLVPQDRSLWLRIARLHPAWKSQAGSSSGTRREQPSERSRQEFKSDRFNRGDRRDRPARADRSERPSFDRPKRSEQTERRDQPERQARGERSARPERRPGNPQGGVRRFEDQRPFREQRQDRGQEKRVDKAVRSNLLEEMGFDASMDRKKKPKPKSGKPSTPYQVKSPGRGSGGRSRPNSGDRRPRY